MKKLLVVVDMQNDFVDGALGTARAAEILPVVQKRIEEFRSGGGEVVFTLDTHGGNYLSTQEGRRLPVPHCVKGTEGHLLTPALQPLARGARLFEKGSFGSVELAEYARLGGYGEIALCGVCTDICVVSNALLIKAYCPESEVKVYENACAGTNEENHSAALATMRSCQIEIL